MLSWYAGKDSLKPECMLLMKNNVKSCDLEVENKTFPKRVRTYLPDPNAT